MFYIVDSNGTKYILKKGFEISEYFKKIAHENKSYTPLEILTTTHYDAISKTNYFSNTPEIVKFLINYINIWEDEIKNEDYVNNDGVCTNNIGEILKKKDIDLINNFINFNDSTVLFSCDHPQINENNEILYCDTCLEKSIVMRKYNLIQQISSLILTSENYGFTGLTKKLVCFVATILWDCNQIDINVIESLETFQEWKEKWGK